MKKRINLLGLIGIGVCYSLLFAPTLTVCLGCSSYKSLQGFGPRMNLEPLIVFLIHHTYFVSYSWLMLFTFSVVFSILFVVIFGLLGFLRSGKKKKKPFQRIGSAIILSVIAVCILLFPFIIVRFV